MAYRPRRGLRSGFGDAAADSANYLKMAQSVNPGSALYNAIMACAANPTPTCATASASWFNAGYYTPAQQSVLDQAAASGNVIPVMQANYGLPPGTFQPTTPAAPPPPVTAPSTVVQSSSGDNIHPAWGAHGPRSIDLPGPAQTAAPVAATQPPGIPYVPVTIPAPTDSGGFFSTSWLGIPAWLWLVGGGVGLYAFAGGGAGHGRY